MQRVYLTAEGSLGRRARRGPDTRAWVVRPLEAHYSMACFWRSKPATPAGRLTTRTALPTITRMTDL